MKKTRRNLSTSHWPHRGCVLPRITKMGFPAPYPHGCYLCHHDSPYQTRGITEAAQLRFRKLNIISLICWGVFALLGFLLLRRKPIGAEGQWFLLSAYLFLVVHGLLVMLPAKE